MFLPFPGMPQYFQDIFLVDAPMHTSSGPYPSQRFISQYNVRISAGLYDSNFCTNYISVYASLVCLVNLPHNQAKMFYCLKIRHFRSINTASIYTGD